MVISQFIDIAFDIWLAISPVRDIAFDTLGEISQVCDVAFDKWVAISQVCNIAFEEWVAISQVCDIGFDILRQLFNSSPAFSKLVLLPSPVLLRQLKFRVFHLTGNCIIFQAYSVA